MRLWRVLSIRRKVFLKPSSWAFVMANPWDIPPTKARGDKTPVPIYTAVGLAMSAWEFIETDLSSMFAVFSGATTWTATAPAVRAYGSIVSYRARREALTAAARAFFKVHHMPREQRSFKIVLKKCDGWSDRRNDIAHGLALRVTSIAPGYFLWPTPSNTRKYHIDSTEPAYRYRASQIKKIAFSFKKVRKQTLKLANRLEAKMIDRERTRRQLAERVRQVNETYNHRAQDQAGRQSPKLPPRSSE